MTPRLLGQRHSLCASRKAKAMLDWDREQHPIVGSGATAQAAGHYIRTALTTDAFCLRSPNVPPQTLRKSRVTSVGQSQLPFILICQQALQQSVVCSYSPCMLFSRYLKSNNTCSIRINVTIRRVRVTSVALEKQQLLHVLSVCL